MFAPLIFAFSLCATEVNGVTLFGRAGARRHALLALKPHSTKRSTIQDLSSHSVLLSSRALELRGGSDRGRSDGYGSSDRKKDDYYGTGRRNIDYDDRRRYSDYGYQDDRYYPHQEDDNRGRSPDYYGYQQDDGREPPYYEEDRYSQRDYYDDRGASKKSSSKAMSGMPSIVKFGNKRVGFMLLAFGAISTFLGITMFFNKGLLRIGNLLFIAGVPMTIGPGRTAGYFFQPKKSRATACLVLGIMLVLSGHPIIGMVLEFFGFLNLFGNMFPVALAVLRQMPIVGNLFGNGGGRTRRPSKRRDNYYEDDGREPGGDAERYY